MSDIIIGLTGGVASGKSEVSRRFESLGVHVADADVAARAAVAPGSAGLADVVAAFGADMLDARGMLDRARMRQQVFADAGIRRRLEEIVHPRVRATLRAECEVAPGAYAVAAIPLLAEGGGRSAYPWLARILVVDVRSELQHARLLHRDGIDTMLAARMIAAQATREQRLAIADDVLVNDVALQMLDEQVAALDSRYLALVAS